MGGLLLGGIPFQQGSVLLCLHLHAGVCLSASALPDAMARLCAVASHSLPSHMAGYGGISAGLSFVPEYTGALPCEAEE